MLSATGDQDMSHWYSLLDINCQPMYNEYAKWVRDHCAGTVNNVGYPYVLVFFFLSLNEFSYSFSTDDVHNGGATSYCLTTDVSM